MEPDSSKTPVMNPQTISESYDTSILVRRWAGAWIDFIVISAIFLIPDWLLGNERYQLLLPLWIFLAFAYFPVLEGFTGRTIGKFVTFTVVVDALGQNPGLLRAFLRTLTRILEVNPILFGGIPAGIVVLASKRRQRVGDMIAKTFVLKSGDLSKLTTRSTSA